MIWQRVFGHAQRHVVGYLALAVALGGTAYAATELPRHSVGTKQLEREAVTNAKVKRHSLTQGLFRPGELPAASKPVVRFKPVPGAPGGEGEVNRSHVAECRAGERATGGGYEISDDRAFPIASVPFPGDEDAKPTAWRVTVHDPTAGLISWSVYVVCVAR